MRSPSTERLQFFLQQMFRRRRGDIFLFICIVAVTLYGIHVFRERYQSRRAAALQLHEEVQARLLLAPYRTVGNECSPMTQNCYTIVDVVRKERRQMVVERVLMIDDLQGYAHSTARLAVPQELTWENANFSAWPLDKKMVSEGYFQMMIIAPFATEALEIPSKHKQKILMLGLGGGTISNFFSVASDFGIIVETTVVEIDPFMVDLARQYFNVVNAKGVSNIVTTDGELFLRTAVEKKAKYRAILLDACYSADELGTGLLCPVERFFDSKVIKDIYDALDDGGTLAVNTAFNANVTEHEDRATDLYSQVFPSCDMIAYGAMQKMLICTKKADWSFRDQGARFIMNIRRVNKLFDFTLHRYF